MPDEISEEDAPRAATNPVQEGERMTFTDWAERQTGTRPKLDFSQFHPLDHRLGDARCRECYGGPKRHIWLWWNFKFDYKPTQLWHREVLCRLGRHVATKARRRPSPDAPWEPFLHCRWCLKPL